MSLQTDSLRDIENRRQQSLRHVETEGNDPDPERFLPGTFGCHELLDRTALLADLIERSILSHPACIKNREWYELAAEASAILHDLYQRIGSTHLELTGKPEAAT
jgi:hypothetical protein